VRQTETMFIGSSSEGLPLAEVIAARLRVAHPTIKQRCWWHREVFRHAETFIESLERESKAATCAIFVVTPDDTATIREQEKEIPRDNVIFEYGLFAGLCGRSRVAIVQVNGAKLPTDLSGMSVAPVQTNDNEDEFADNVVDALRDWTKRLKILDTDPLPAVSEFLLNIRPSLSQWERDSARRFDRTAAQLLRVTAVSALTDNQGVNKAFADLSEAQLPNCLSVSAYDATGPAGWVGADTYRYLAAQVREYLYANGAADRWEPYVHDWLYAALTVCLERATQRLVDGESKTRFDNEKMPGVGTPRLQYSRILVWTREELADPSAEPIIDFHEAFRIPLFYLPVAERAAAKQVAFVVFEKRNHTCSALYGVKKHNYDTARDQTSLSSGRIPGLGDALEEYKRALLKPDLMLAKDARELSIGKTRPPRRPVKPSRRHPHGA
jgi:predicted nucleotide-binding protein with TIR-like domain